MTMSHHCRSVHATGSPHRYICERDKLTIALLEMSFAEVSMHDIAGVPAWLPMGCGTTLAGERTTQQMQTYAAGSQHCDQS